MSHGVSQWRQEDVYSLVFKKTTACIYLYDEYHISLTIYEPVLAVIFVYDSFGCPHGKHILRNRTLYVTSVYTQSLLHKGHADNMSWSRVMFGPANLFQSCSKILQRFTLGHLEHDGRQVCKHVQMLLSGRIYMNFDYNFTNQAPSHYLNTWWSDYTKLLVSFKVKVFRRFVIKPKIFVCICLVGRGWQIR